MAYFLCVQKSPPIAAPSVILVPGPCSCLRVSDEVASGKDPIPMLARLAGVGWKSSRTSVRLTPWKSASRASGIQGFRWSRPGSADELAGGDMPRCSTSLPASGMGFAPGQPCQRRDRAFRPDSLASVANSLFARAITCHSKNVLVKSAQTLSVDTNFASRSSLARSRGRFLL